VQPGTYQAAPLVVALVKQFFHRYRVARYNVVADVAPRQQNATNLIAVVNIPEYLNRGRWMFLPLSPLYEILYHPLFYHGSL
jgi:hypothetical protein